MTFGIPTLRSALRRAETLGATVERVRRTGEVRVTQGDTRLLINARRKDATRELADLISELETRRADRLVSTATPEPPPVRADPTAEPVTGKVVTAAERIRNHLRSEHPADPGGWREWSTQAVADELGLDRSRVAVWVSQSAAPTVRDEGRIEVRKESSGRNARITHVRFISDAAAVVGASVANQPLLRRYDVPGAPGPARAAQEPLPFPDKAEPLGVLPTPLLARYAAAMKAAREEDLLQVTLSPEQDEELHKEAVRLYFWVRAGGAR